MSLDVVESLGECWGARLQCRVGWLTEEDKVCKGAEIAKTGCHRSARTLALAAAESDL